MAKQRMHRIAEMDYAKGDAENLRNRVIALRSAALEQDDFENSVMLSHVVAFMAVAIEQMYGDKR